MEEGRKDIKELALLHNPMQHLHLLHLHHTRGLGHGSVLFMHNCVKWPCAHDLAMAKILP